MQWISPSRNSELSPIAIAFRPSFFKKDCNTIFKIAFLKAIVNPSLFYNVFCDCHQLHLALMMNYNCYSLTIRGATLHAHCERFTEI